VLEQFPLLRSVTSIERDEHLDALARILHGAHDVPVDQRSQDITQPGDWPRHDLVVIGHVLNELSPNARAAVIARAWAATEHVLLIVEPGTSAFFPILTETRSLLSELGATIVAPCTHAHPCPMRDDWCHYATKIARPDFQRHARQAALPYEEAKYSYITVTRLPHVATGVRVLHDTTTHKGYITLEHCSARGIQTSAVLKRHPAAYRQARDAQWGSWLSDETVFGASQPE
jgi:ribosomal protein RSM22 (predicted rRNA methylase)